jgi:hypothetical protein
VSEVQTGTVTTKFPARPDRLPWSRWRNATTFGHAQVLEDIAQPLTASEPGPQPQPARAAT